MERLTRRSSTLLALCLGLAYGAGPVLGGDLDVELSVSLAQAELESGTSTTLTFELVNNSANLLTDVDIDFDLVDGSGLSALADFVIDVPNLVGIGDVDGSSIFANLNPGGTATASFAVTPLASAAAGGPATYILSSSLAGVVEGTFQLLDMPTQVLRVLPIPRLEVELYWPSVAHGDWSSTSSTFEQGQDFSIGAVVRNTGAGTAFGLSFISPGPLFAVDLAGAPIFAEVFEVEVDGNTIAGGFSLPAGSLSDLGPGQERRIRWRAGANFEATLVGFPASFFASGALLPIATLTNESLVHVAETFETAADPFDDGRIDWLVNESNLPAPIDPTTGVEFTEFPSTVRSSVGPDLALIAQTSPALGSAPTNANLMSTASITVGAPGWYYLRFDDPGGALFDLAGVTRAQGTLQLGALSVGVAGGVSRAWTTARPTDSTSDGLPDTIRRELHIVDFLPTSGVWQYDLAYIESTATSLSADKHVISAQSGGVQNLTLDAGPAHAGEIYFLLGSQSGTSPGTPVAQALLPLNVDGYFLELLLNPSLQALFGSVGILDAQGRGAAQIAVPVGFGVGLGIAAHHAFVTLPAIGPIGFASNAVAIFVLP